MKVIQEANKVIANVWGKQKKKDVSYRLIKYVLKQDVEEGVLLYHLVTGELILLEASDHLNMDILPTHLSNEWLQLIEKKFLVEIDFDEMKSVSQLKKIMHKISNKHDGISSYTIMPTSHCNARCFYCFEADFPYKHMSEETATRLVEYMDEHCGENRFLNLTWFGGEPTVNPARIDQICKGLQEKGIEYSSFMYSNGYLFDDEMVQKAIDLWKLNKIQITLDGTEEVYNKAKAYKAVTGSPYRRVIENIKKLLDAGIYVTIRLNMDYYNYEDLKKLISLLTDRFAQYEYMDIYVRILFEGEGYQEVKHSDNEIIDLENKKNELDYLILKNKKHQLINTELPFLKTVHCCADSDSNLLINPDGKIGKCDHFPYEKIIGDIRKSDIDEHQLFHIKKVVEIPKCMDCSSFPICHKLDICFNIAKCNDISITRKISIIKKNMIFKYYELKNSI